MLTNKYCRYYNIILSMVKRQKDVCDPYQLFRQAKIVFHSYFKFINLMMFYYPFFYTLNQQYSQPVFVYRY